MNLNEGQEKPAEFLNFLIGCPNAEVRRGFFRPCPKGAI